MKFCASLVLALALLTTSAKAQFECDNGFYPINGMGCYYLSVAIGNYFEAADYCEQFQAHLVEITDSFEQNNVASYLQQNNIGSVWLGMRNDVGDVSDWVWTSSGQTVTNFFWGGSDPDNVEQHCATMFRLYNHLWVNVFCDDVNPVPAHAMCEKDF